MDFARFIAITAMITSLAVVATPTMAQGRPAQTAANDGSDFVQDGLKFHSMYAPRPGMAVNYTVVDMSTNNPVGNVMVRSDGNLRVLAYPGADSSKIEAAFKKHQSGGDNDAQAMQATVPIGNGASPSTSVPPAPNKTNGGWDAAKNEATLPNGTSVTFTDKDNIHVVQGNGKEYWVKHVGKSAGGLFRTWASNQQGRGATQGTGGFDGIGSSLLGEGIEITQKVDFGDGNPRIVPAFSSQTGSNDSVAARQQRLGSLVDAIKQAVAEVPAERTDITKSIVVKKVLHLNVMGG